MKTPKEVRQLIAANKIKEAIEVMQQCEDQYLSNSLLLQASRWSNLQKDIRLGIKTSDYLDRKHNQIVLAVTDLVEEYASETGQSNANVTQEQIRSVPRGRTTYSKKDAIRDKIDEMNTFIASISFGFDQDFINRAEAIRQRMIDYRIEHEKDSLYDSSSEIMDQWSRDRLEIFAEKYNIQKAAKLATAKNTRDKINDMKGGALDKAAVIGVARSIYQLDETTYRVLYNDAKEAEGFQLPDIMGRCNQAIIDIIADLT